MKGRNDSVRRRTTLQPLVVRKRGTTLLFWSTSLMQKREWKNNENKIHYFWGLGVSLALMELTK